MNKANLCKYEQNADLRQLLLDTGDRTIVEASPKVRTSPYRLVTCFAVTKGLQVGVREGCH